MSLRPAPAGAGLPARVVAVLCSVALLAGVGLHASLTGGDPENGESGRAAATPAQGSDARPEAPPAVAPAGPTRTEHGVPSGFSRSEQGAVAAASAYVCTGQALLDMDPLAAEQAVRHMAAADTADEQAARVLDQLAQARQALAAGVGPITYRQGVISWRVDAYSQDEARIALWYVGVLSRQGAAPPQAGWATSTLDLVWERGDWKVAREGVVPGPAPILDDSTAPATTGLFDAALDGFIDAEARW